MGAALKLELPEPPEFQLPKPANAMPPRNLQHARAQFLAENQAKAADTRRFADDYMAFLAKLRATADEAAKKAWGASGPQVLQALAEGLEERERHRAAELLPQLEILRRHQASLAGLATSVAAPWRPVLRDLIESATSELEILRDLRLRLVRVASDVMERDASEGPVFSSGSEAVAYLASRRGK